MRSTEAHVADKGVSAAIEVTGVEVSAQAILLV